MVKRAFNDKLSILLSESGNIQETVLKEEKRNYFVNVFELKFRIKQEKC